MAKAEQLYVQ